MALMLGAAAALGIACWFPLRQEEHNHIQQVTTILARSVETDISDEVREHMAALVRLSDLFSVGREISPQTRESQAKLLMMYYPGYIAVEYLDANLALRWVTVSSADEINLNKIPRQDEVIRGALQDIVNHGRDRKGLLFTPSFRLPNGKLARRLITPIYQSEKLMGFLIAIVDQTMSFTEILKDQADHGYAISVFEENEEVYRSSGSSSETKNEWSQDVQLRFAGATWRVRVWPELPLVRKLKSGLPELGFILGSMIGLLLFFAFDLARTKELTSQELRWARDEVEFRVQERTTELRAINERLGIEINERTQAEDSLRELSSGLLRLRDEEQRRIARELHDSTAQILGALAINLEKLQKLDPGRVDSKARKLLAESTDLLEAAIAEVRTISYLLHPPILDDLGLEGVLPWYADGFSNRSGIRVELDMPPDLGRLPRDVELTLFRIVQEGLTNILRHSGSSTASITILKEANSVTLTIKDFGRGLSPEILEGLRDAKAVGGVGISGMRERVRQLGGEFEIVSDDSGTAIEAKLPIAVSSASTETRQSIDALLP